MDQFPPAHDWLLQERIHSQLRIRICNGIDGLLDLAPLPERAVAHTAHHGPRLLWNALEFILGDSKQIEPSHSRIQRERREKSPGARKSLGDAGALHLVVRLVVLRLERTPRVHVATLAAIDDAVANTANRFPNLVWRAVVGIRAGRRGRFHQNVGQTTAAK